VEGRDDGDPPPPCRADDVDAEERGVLQMHELRAELVEQPLEGARHLRVGVHVGVVLEDVVVRELPDRQAFVRGAPQVVSRSPGVALRAEELHVVAARAEPARHEIGHELRAGEVLGQELVDDGEDPHVAPRS
jgi:hypothetical protein